MIETGVGLAQLVARSLDCRVVGRMGPHQCSGIAFSLQEARSSRGSEDHVKWHSYLHLEM